MARDIILNLAISLDGFICDEDGGFAWISGQGDVRADTADHFDFDGFLASCDTIVMGRKAYEDCLSSLPEAAEKRFLVASRTPRAPEGRVVFLSADVVAEVLALKDRPGKHIWLFGGGELASDFKKQNGYLRSLQLSEEYGLYRQDYCGCEFSAKARGIGTTAGE